MKKFLTLAGVSVLTLGASWAIDWTSVDNLAKDAPVVVSSRFNDAATVTDNNVGTSWQADPSTHGNTHDWALIDLGESRSFSDIEITWEASHPATYSVYVSDTAIPYASVTPEEGSAYNTIDEEWLAGATAFAKRELEGESGVTDLISKDGEGRYILIYADSYNGFGTNYGIRIFEVRVGNLGNRNAVAKISVTPAELKIVEGATAEVTVNPLNILGDVLDADAVSGLTLTCSNPDAVEIEAGETGKFTVKGLKAGMYTLTATADSEDEVLTADAKLTVEYAWEGVVNLAIGKTVSARHISEEGFDYTNPAANAVDGDKETYYEYNGNWGGGDSWVLVDLGEEYLIDAIGADYKVGGGRVSFGYALEYTDAENKLENTDYKWDNSIQGFTFTPEVSRGHNANTTYVFETPVKARYIVVRDNDNPNGKPQLAEIYVKGSKYQTPVATELTVETSMKHLLVGESATLSAKVIDQYGAEMENAEVTYSIDGDSEAGTLSTDGGVTTFTAEAIGMCEITAAAGDVTAKVTVNVAAHPDSKLNTSLNMHEGVSLINGNTAWEWANSLFENAENDKAAIVEFKNEIGAQAKADLSMIEIYWEAACAGDYDVKVVHAAIENGAVVDGETETVLTVTGREFEAGVNPKDRVATEQKSESVELSGRAYAPALTQSGSLDNVTKIMVTPRTNAAAGKNFDYTVKLLGVNSYGEYNNDGVVVTAVNEISDSAETVVDVYSVTGTPVRAKVERDNALVGLPAGIYVIGNKKVIVK